MHALNTAIKNLFPKNSFDTSNYSVSNHECNTNTNVSGHVVIFFFFFWKARNDVFLFLNWTAKLKKLEKIFFEFSICLEVREQAQNPVFINFLPLISILYLIRINFLSVVNKFEVHHVVENSKYFKKNFKFLS